MYTVRLTFLPHDSHYLVEQQLTLTRSDDLCSFFSTVHMQTSTDMWRGGMIVSHGDGQWDIETHHNFIVRGSV